MLNLCCYGVRGGRPVHVGGRIYLLRPWTRAFCPADTGSRWYQNVHIVNSPGGRDGGPAEGHHHVRADGFRPYAIHVPVPAVHRRRRREAGRGGGRGRRGGPAPACPRSEGRQPVRRPEDLRGV